MSVFPAPAFLAWLWLAAPAASASAPIPYRTEAAVPAGSFVLALGVTALLLLLLFGLLFQLRRRGWISGTRMPQAPAQRIELLATQRVSMGVSAHVIAYEGRRYLIVEGARGSHATLAPVDLGPRPQDGTP